MLAVLDKSVAKSPGALNNPNSDSVSALKDGFLTQHFSSQHVDSLTINLGVPGFLAYSNDKQNPFLPRLFAVVDDIFCLFQGHIENVAHLKQQYGLSKTANEVIIVIEAYRTLRIEVLILLIRMLMGVYPSSGELILKGILFYQMMQILLASAARNPLHHFQKDASLQPLEA